MRPILLELAGVRVYSYGALIVLGGLLSGWFLHTRRRRMGLEREARFLALFHAVFLGGFIGGRGLHLVEYAPWSDWPRAAFALREGFSVLGAFGGVLAGVWALCRALGLSFPRVLDYVCQVAPFWHFFGRLGCLAAGCCCGVPAPGLRWAVTFRNPASSAPADLLGVPLHPVQLYEGLADLGLAALLYRLVLRRVEAGVLPEGTVAAGYFAGYGLLRFLLEPLRSDTVPFLGPLTAGQAGSLALIAAGAALARSAFRAR